MTWRLVVASAVVLVTAGVLVLRRGHDEPKAAAPRSAAPAEAGGGLFQDVTAGSGLTFRQRTADGAMDDMIEAVGCGATVFDYDGDGRLDVFLLQGQGKGGAAAPAGTPVGSRLFRNLGGMRFEDVTEKAGLVDAGGGFSAAAGDVDGDGDVDLLVFRDGPNRLWRNRGDGTFEECAATAGVAGTSCSVAGTLLDYDGDGDLDLYVANYLSFDPGYRLHYAPDAFPGPLAFDAQPDRLYRNRGDGTFEDVSASAGLPAVPGRGMGVVACDFDDDGRPDVFVANDASANHYLRNLGGGRFEECGEAVGLAFGFHGEATGAMAGVVGDVDGDGRPDLNVTDTHYGSLYRNGAHGFRDCCAEAGIASLSAPWVSWGGAFLDFDNDGDLDLFIADGDLHYVTGRPDLLLENRGDGHFVDASDRGGPHFRRRLPSRAAVVADLDDDGSLDLLVTQVEGPPVLLRGRPTPGRHWVGLALRGTRSNRGGFGARVTVKAGGRTWVLQAHVPSGYLAQDDPRLHVGLGSATQVDDVTVRWPTGQEESYGRLAADRTHTLVEGRGTP